MKKSVFIIMVIVFAIACKKKNNTTTNSTSNTTPPPTTTTTNSLYVTFTDSSKVKSYQCQEWNCSNYALVTPPLQISYVNYQTGYNLVVLLPYDSSSIKTVPLNKKFLVKAYSKVGGYSHPTSALGNIELESSSSNGDKFIDQVDTLTHYNKITSISYYKRAYNSLKMQMEAWWIVKGEFNVLVKNGATNQNRVWSNGSYSLIVRTNTL